MDLDHLGDLQVQLAGGHGGSKLGRAHAHAQDAVAAAGTGVGIGDGDEVAGIGPVLLIHQLVDDALAPLVEVDAELLGKVVHGPHAVAGLFGGGGVDVVHNQDHPVGVKDLLDPDFPEHLDGDWGGHIVGRHVAHPAGQVVPGVGLLHPGSSGKVFFNAVHGKTSVLISYRAPA